VVQRNTYTECIPTKRIIYSGGFTPPPPPPPGSFELVGTEFTHAADVVSDPTKVPGDLADYLWYINLAAMPASFWSATQSGLQDVWAGTTDGATRFPMYINAYNKVGNTGYAFVFWNAAFSGVNPNTVRIYYGNSGLPATGVADAFGRNATFANFAKFVDMAQDPSAIAPQLTDLTGNSNDMTTQGSMTTGNRVDGKVGSWWQFDGTDDAATKTTPSYRNDTQGSITLWAKVNSVFGSVATKAYFSIGGAAQTDSALWHIGKRRIAATGTPTYFHITNRTGGNSLVRGFSATTTSLAAGTTYQIVIASTGGEWRVFVNNVAQSLTTWGSQNSNNGDWFGDINPTTPIISAIAAHYSNGGLTSGQFSDDDIGPLYIRSTNPSNNTITTEYNNQNSPETFHSITEA